MARSALRIQVTTKDQKELIRLLSGGVQQVKVVLRAVALLQLAKGVSAPRVSGVVPLTPQAIRKVGHRYQEGGLQRALYERQRPGAAPVLEDSQKQRIIAMVCSDPPEGRARWTVRLVAEEAVKRRLVPQVGRETIRIGATHWKYVRRVPAGLRAPSPVHPVTGRMVSALGVPFVLLPRRLEVLAYSDAQSGGPLHQ
jgi:putative transposase